MAIYIISNFSSKFRDDFASDYPKWEIILPVPDWIKWKISNHFTLCQKEMF